jgi:hypothetical protein
VNTYLHSFRIGDGDKGIGSAHRVGSFHHHALSTELGRPAGALATNCTIHVQRRFADNPHYSNVRVVSPSNSATTPNTKSTRAEVEALFKQAVRAITISECDALVSQMKYLDTGIAAYLSTFDKTSLYQSYLIKAGCMTLEISNNNSDESL